MKNGDTLDVEGQPIAIGDEGTVRVRVSDLSRNGRDVEAVILDRDGEAGPQVFVIPGGCVKVIRRK